jgi:transposase
MRTAPRGSRRCRRLSWRWQLILDSLGAEEPPFSKGTLVGFRQRLIERSLDRRLVERTVDLAAATGGFGARALRAALDSSPLCGAGRVEDSFNLDGTRPAQGSGRDRGRAGLGQAAVNAVMAAMAGVPQLAASSLKAALDADWDDPAARDEALAEVLNLLDRVDAFITGQAADEAAVVAIHHDEALLAELRQRQQTPEGRVKLRERVAVEHARPTPATHKAAAPATAAPARTCSTCAALPSSQSPRHRPPACHRQSSARRLTAI